MLRKRRRRLRLRLQWQRRRFRVKEEETDHCKRDPVVVVKERLAESSRWYRAQWAWKRDEFQRGRWPTSRTLSFQFRQL